MADLKALGRAVAARRASLEMTQADVAIKASVSARSVHNLESGATWPQAANRERIEQALGWAPGSLEAIRDGGEPTELVGHGPSQSSSPTAAWGTGPAKSLHDGLYGPDGPMGKTGAAMEAGIAAHMPTIELDSVIRPSMLDAVTAAGLPDNVVATIKRASDTAGSILLDQLTQHLPIEERARLAWEIVERLEAQGIDVEKLLDEEVDDVPDLGVTSDGQVWERDRHGNWAAVRTIKMESRGVIWVGRRSAFMPADTVTSRFGDITILDKKVLRDLLREAGSRAIKPESIAAAALQSTSSVRDDLAARRDSNSRGRGAGKRTDEMTDEELADLADTDETWAGYVETRSETADEEI